MADNEGVRRRDVLKGIGFTGAAASLATTNVAAVAKEAQAQPTQSHAHAPAPARNDNTADVFRFFTAPEAAVVVALVDAAALPSSVTNSRRFITRSPHRRGRATSKALQGQVSWRPQR
jgi:hypothetical protein